MQQPNFRVEANRLMGCIGMQEDDLRQEIITALEHAYHAGKEIKEVALCQEK
jgi:hypothetical protein